jgi:hypothetical protein
MMPDQVRHDPARDRMIDNLALGLTHGLMLLAAWRLLSRPDLDREGDAPARRRAGRRRPLA